jgi:hypothetical protein
MAELGWTTSEVTQEHLQNRVSQGYMIAVELVPVVCPRILRPLLRWGGYIMACTVVTPTFYKNKILST